MGLLDSFTGNAGKEAAAKNAALYQQYGTNAAGALDTGLQKSEGALNSGISAFTPLSDLGKSLGQGTSAYMDSLGLNGPEGTARSRAAYQTSPGFGFQVDTATDAAARNAAKLGLAGSGNTLQEISDRAGNIALSDFGKYQDRLGGFINPQLQAESTAAGGQAAGYGNLSNLYQNDAQNRIGVYGNVTSGQASANNAEAKAKTDGSANFWNSLIKVGAIAAAPFTGGLSLGAMAMPGMGDSSGNPGNMNYGSNPFTPSGGRNPAYG